MSAATGIRIGPTIKPMQRHIPAPYPDAIMHLSTIWMLTPFGPETGGTYITPREAIEPTTILPQQG